MASEDAKQLMALQAAMGMSKAQIARVHGYTPSGISGVFSKPEMEALVEEKRLFLQANAESAMLRLIMNFDQSVQNICNIGNDINHKDSLKANQFVVTTVLGPQKQISEQHVEVHHKVTADVTGQVLDGILDLQHVVKHAGTGPEIGEDPHLLEGGRENLDGS